MQDKLAIRASIYQGEDSGFIDNVGAVDKKDTNLNRSTQFRIAARWFATDKLTVDASVTYEKSHAYGLNGGFSGLGEYKNSTNSPEGTRDNFLLYNVGVDYDLGWANLISSTSYTQRHIGLRASPERQIAYFFQDYGTGLPVGQGAYPLFTQPTTYNQAITNAIPAEYYTINNKIHDVMQELRITSKPHRGPFKWTAGVFFEEQRRNYVQDIPTPGFDKLSYQNLFYGPFSNADGTTAYNSQLTDQAFSPDDIFSGIQNQEEHQVAVFGEGTYTLFNKLDLTVGLRYFNFQENFNLFFSGVYGVDPGPGPNAHKPLVTQNTLSSDGVNPRFNASYHVNDDILVYAEAAKGFRYGGVNQPVPLQFCGADLATAHLTSAPQTYGPDSLWSYSVGEKAKLANGRITLNTDAFYIDWSDVQTRLLLGQCSYYFIQNKGRDHQPGPGGGDHLPRHRRADPDGQYVLHRQLRQRPDREPERRGRRPRALLPQMDHRRRRRLGPPPGRRPAAAAGQLPIPQRPVHDLRRQTPTSTTPTTIRPPPTSARTPATSAFRARWM